MAGPKPMRLPPLRVFRVRNPNKTVENPCIAKMSSVLACWASAGYNTAGCARLESALRTCMDQKALPTPPRATINHHLGRFYSRMIGNTKRK